MINYTKITDETYWVGGSDRRLSRFENIFPLEDGVSYNSYVIADENTALFDTADISISDQFLENVAGVLGDKKLDYLIINHMEPDHCSQIATVVAMYPEVTLVGNAKTFTFLSQFFPELGAQSKITVAEGDTLELGKHTLTFVMAPMVHWPEAMFTYDKATGALFSADAFGTFGAIDAGIFADEYDFEKKFLDEARRYYANIVGKYGMQVQAVLKKAAAIDIKYICPLHGPIWRENIAWFIDKYQKWSTYTPEDDEIVVIYGSLYGHTESAAQRAAAMIREKSGKKVSVYDVSQTHPSKLISEVWRCGKIVLFCPTYNNGIYIPMENFLSDCQALTVQNRIFALAQNGTWAPASGKLMTEKLQTLKNVTIVEPVLTIKSALHVTDEPELEAFVTAVVEA
ncbi:FprA family A-type flavoprotein [Butyrivibrio sp. INlla16]|uniref:FprA family A-type flavoprotein n=1 Tax=Butyrivibrio sp. INlla16 TaxID=1520807 RepID=UPI00087E3A7E|nr:FprA family A-type flavoprotein [Butyrivibrio sp. INlla16]SDB61489.1 Flavorubredoxin [Butyrivibrio sp. INlla16]